MSMRVCAGKMLSIWWELAIKNSSMALALNLYTNRASLSKSCILYEKKIALVLHQVLNPNSVNALHSLNACFYFFTQKYKYIYITYKVKLLLCPEISMQLLMCMFWNKKSKFFFSGRYRASLWQRTHTHFSSIPAGFTSGARKLAQVLK